MELRDYIEAAKNKLGSVESLAKLLDQQSAAIRSARLNKRGLPNYACVKLADLLGVERIEVIAASELVTEKNPERREVWLPFVLAAEARMSAQNAQSLVAADVKTAPDKPEPSDNLVVGHSPATDSSMNVRKTGCSYSCVPMRKV